MKSKDSLKDFKNLTDTQIVDKVKELRKELFDLRFKQATRQLSETHKFKFLKKQIAQLLTLSQGQPTTKTPTD